MLVEQQQGVPFLAPGLGVVGFNPKRLVEPFELELMVACVLSLFGQVGEGFATKVGPVTLRSKQSIRGPDRAFPLVGPQ